jgi:single-strand DNA-binding protein
MGKGVNKVMLLGHVGSAPEIRATKNGTAVANFSVATTEREKDARGNWADKAEWHRLVALWRVAEIVRDYVKKGTQLFIEGKLQTRSWEDRQSQKRMYSTEILVLELTLLGGGGNGSGRQTSSSNDSTGVVKDYGFGAAPGGADAGEFEAGDDDVPF